MLGLDPDAARRPRRARAGRDRPAAAASAARPPTWLRRADKLLAAMATQASAVPADPELDATAWDLEPLVDGDGQDGVEPRLASALTQAQSFAERYTGRVSELDGATLAQAMRELAAIQELIGRSGTFAALRFAVDTAEPATGALLQLVQERATAIQTTLLFFELEWAALDEDRAEQLLSFDGLDFCRHYLRNVRRYREHLLSEPEERILAEKAVTGSSAWTRLFEELTSAISVKLPGAEKGASAGEGKGANAPGEQVALEVALSRLTLPDRDLRRGTAEAVSSALQEGLRTRVFLFNTLLADKGTDDRLRRYPNWLAERNLANEVSDESVQALLAAVRARSEIPQRWYKLKARLLGIEQLADYDRMAPVTEDEVTFSFGDAREIVTECYASFSPQLGDLARRFFDERHIDAPVRPAKRGGAFCTAAVPDVYPYVMLNFTSRRRDVLTLAHELGHGVHFALAARQGIFHQSTPLTLAETASVFGETIVFNRLLQQDSTPASRLALLAASLEDTIATVFRQVAMNRFEELAHTARREQGELAPERFGDLWVQSQGEMFGDSVHLTDGYRCWWSYIPHFIGSPGYVYAYAYGQLLALSVYERYLQQGAELVPRYLELLAAGGSKEPEQLGEIVGVDLSDPGFWDAGLDLVQRQLQDAEEAARAAGRA
jgi:oligoendopeptidase F